MAIYLKKFETQAAYEAAQSGLILPNVSLTVDNNTVHYNPSTSPTPQSCITAITEYDEEVEVPFCGWGGTKLHFSRLVSFDELQNMEIVADFDNCTDPNPQILTPNIVDDVIKWGDFYSISIPKFEGYVNSVPLGQGDYPIWYERIYLE